MTTSSAMLLGIGFALALLGTTISARADGADQIVPRYALLVGQELTYRGNSEFKHQDGAYRRKGDSHVWVTRQNGDGSWRIVVRSSDESLSTRGAEPLWNNPWQALAALAAVSALAGTPLAFVVLGRSQRFRVWRGRTMRRSLCVSIVVALMLVMGISAIFLAGVVKSRYIDPYRYVSDGPPHVTLYDFDLFPDGRVVTNDSLGLAGEPSALFQRLPRDVAEAREGWESMGRDGESRLAYKLAGSAVSDSLVIQATSYDPLFRIYLMSFRWKSFFDRKRGLIRRIESEDTQGYGFVGKGTGTEELVAVQQHDSDWTREFADESSHYFDTIRAYQELLTRAGKDAEHTVALLAQAETTLKDARAKLGHAVLREGMDEKLADHKKLPPYWSNERKNRAAVIGHAAADWETTDLAGKRHALKDYRGKVVILDFWYRGCFWCIRAMPQMIQIADDFRDQPVAVLGMNIDHEAKDAQFVADQMKLNYPVLKAAELQGKYRVSAFPTLIIIDRDGKVADVHVGYTKTLHAEVSKSVKSLLSKQ